MLAPAACSLRHIAAPTRFAPPVTNTTLPCTELSTKLAACNLTHPNFSIMLSLPVPSPESQAHSDELRDLIHQEIALQGGWIQFARFMELALYAPGLGYYSTGSCKLGEAGDFVTAPEISSLFGCTLALQLEIMPQTALHIIELGAGSGKLAADILSELERRGLLPVRYDILEVSPDLRDRQQKLLKRRVPHLIDRIHWLDALPDSISGVLIANEVLDACRFILCAGQMQIFLSAVWRAWGKILFGRNVCWRTQD